MSLNTDLISELISGNGFTSVHDKLARKIGFGEAGMFQIILSKHQYYKSRNELKDYECHDCFYLTNADLEERGFGSGEVKTMKDKLKDLGLIGWVVKGLPAKTYYFLPDDLAQKLIKIFEISHETPQKPLEMPVGHFDSTSKPFQPNKLDILAEHSKDKIEDKINDNSLSGVDPKIESQILEFSDSIQSHPMYPVQIQTIQNTLVIPEELKEKIDELALRECAIAMITDGKSSVGHWAGYLKTGYSKAISDFVTNSRTKIQIQKNEYYEGKKTNQAANPVLNQPAFFDKHPALEPITEQELFGIGSKNSQERAEAEAQNSKKYEASQARNDMLKGFNIGKNTMNGPSQRTANNTMNSYLNSSTNYI
jgi:hypothetical protein